MDLPRIFSTPLTVRRLLCSSCAPLLLWLPLFCFRASHLQGRLYFFGSLCSSGAPSLQDRTQLHWRVVSLADLRNVSAQWLGGTWRDERTLHYTFSRGTKTVWSRRHWRESPHVAIDDVRAFLAERWWWRESSWDPRVIRWRWWRTRAPILEQVFHREFDITSVRTMSIEDRESFAVIVISMLDGVLVDVSLTQRNNRMKCSRVLDVCTSDSSEEETRRWCVQIFQWYDTSSDSAMVSAPWKQIRTPLGKKRASVSVIAVVVSVLVGGKVSLHVTD